MGLSTVESGTLNSRESDPPALRVGAWRPESQTLRGGEWERRGSETAFQLSVSPPKSLLYYIFLQVMPLASGPGADSPGYVPLPLRGRLRPMAASSVCPSPKDKYALICPSWKDKSASVCADLEDPATRQREMRALEEGMRFLPTLQSPKLHRSSARSASWPTL